MENTVDLLIVYVIPTIPTIKYFESRFDHMQFQIGRINQDINEFKTLLNSKCQYIVQYFN